VHTYTVDVNVSPNPEMGAHSPSWPNRLAIIIISCGYTDACCLKTESHCASTDLIPRIKYIGNCYPKAILYLIGKLAMNVQRIIPLQQMSQPVADCVDLDVISL
jgi:hypothetical protein